MTPTFATRAVSFNTRNGGPAYRFTFVNGYRASVIRNKASYGGAEGLWELAVIHPDGGIDYANPIAPGPLGWLTEADVALTINRIAALPAPATATH